MGVGLSRRATSGGLAAFCLAGRASGQGDQSAGVPGTLARREPNERPVDRQARARLFVRDGPGQGQHRWRLGRDWTRPRQSNEALPDKNLGVDPRSGRVIADATRVKEGY